MAASAPAGADTVSLERLKRIEALVSQLESLPPTQLRAALDPLPPARSPVSRETWEQWVAQQASLEREADEFDTVDLQRWKALAKGSSRELRPWLMRVQSRRIGRWGARTRIWSRAR